MRIVSNDKQIQRNARIGQYATMGGLGILVLALVVNFMAIFRPAQEVGSLLTYVIAAFFVGFTLTQVGTWFNNRWGRRPDRGLADALKGLDDRFVLYNYRLGALHVLAGPGGVVVLHPKYQTGPVEYDGKRWRAPLARRGFLNLFNPDPLGNPVLEAAGEVEAFNRFVKKRDPSLAVAPSAAIVFLNPRAEVSAKDSPIPALHVKQLKDYVRRLPKSAAFSPQALARVAGAAPGEAAAETRTKGNGGASPSD